MPPFTGLIGRNRGVMLLDRLFRARPTQAVGRALYQRVVDQARTPRLYAELGAPDTVEGRFEIYSLHVVLLLDRLRGHGAQATETSQALFDTYVKSLDHALREMGVGDLSVGKKMRKLGEAFYGRTKAYDSALAALPDTEPLRALIARTLLGDQATPLAQSIADYVARAADRLAAQPLADIYEARLDWPETAL
jgi:cytochrome b pre-mRNA-processing protein 3